MKVALIVALFCLFGNFYLVTSNCAINEWDNNDCSMTVSYNCYDSFAITNEKQFVCTQGSIFWSYPLGNMTVKFTRNAQASEAFKLTLVDTFYLYDDMPLFRLINGQEVRVDTTQSEVTLTSDSNNAVVLKSVGPTNLQYYGEFINYNINPV